jgi:hypothetical protein
MIKVESNPQWGPKTLKEAHRGDKNWTRKHLPGYMNNEAIFKKKVIPRALKKMGSLEPWAPLTIKIVQDIVDEVFIEKKGEADYIMATDNIWYRLVCL